MDTPEELQNALTNWDGKGNPPGITSVKNTAGYQALSPAGRVQALNQLQRNWADRLRTDGGDYGGNIRDVETDFNTARNTEVENGLADDLRGGTLTEDQVKAYVKGGAQGLQQTDGEATRYVEQRYGADADRAGPWVTTKLPITGADGKSAGYAYLRHMPDLNGDTLAANMRSADDPQAIGYTSFTGAPGSDRVEVSYAINEAAPGKQLTGTLDVNVGKMLAQVQTDKNLQAWQAGNLEGPPVSGGESPIDGVPPAMVPAALAAHAFSDIAQNDPEISGRIGQGFWQGLQGQATKGFLKLGNATVEGSKALFGDKGAVRDWQRQNQEIDADIEGQSRLNFRGGFWDKVATGISEEALPTAISMGTGWLASAARTALSSTVGKTFLSRMAALELENAAKQGAGGMTREAMAKALAGELTGEGVGQSAKQGLVASVSRGLFGKWLGTAEIESHIGRELADRVTNAIAFLPNSARTGLDNMAQTLDAAEAARASGDEKKARQLEDRAVLNGWAGVAGETLSENIWLNEMMVTRTGRGLDDVTTEVLSRRLGAGKMATLVNRAGTLMKEALKSGNEEGIEEIVQGVGNQAWMNQFADQNQDLLEGAGLSYTTGAVMGAFMAAAKHLAHEGEPAILKELLARGLEGDNTAAAAALERIKAKAGSAPAIAPTSPGLPDVPIPAPQQAAQAPQAATEPPLLEDLAALAGNPTDEPEAATTDTPEDRNVQGEPVSANNPAAVAAAAEAAPGATPDLKPTEPVKAESGPEYDLFGEEITEPDITSALAKLETTEVPVDQITLSPDVPQFKEGADSKTGEVEPLGGKFDRTGVAPILLWERNNGRMEVISGRHRLGLARRSGEKTIPAQIVKESQGFTRQMALTADAQLNIRDGQGSIKDFATYFRHSRISAAEAEERGLISRAKGRAGYAIGTGAGDSVFTLLQNDQLSEQAAEAISRAAPGNDGLQRVGAQNILEGRSIEESVNLMRAVQAAGGGVNNGTQLDLFGKDDSALVEMRQQAKRAAAAQRQLREQIGAVKGAVKKPEVARKLGVDVQDPAAVQARVDQLTAELARWENWPMHADLVARTREGGNSVKEGEFALDAQTDEEIGLEKKRKAAETMARLKREQMEAKQAAPLKGRDDTGQGALFTDDTDLFSGPSAEQLLAPKEAANYTHAHGAPVEHPDQPELAAAVQRAQTDAYGQFYLFQKGEQLELAFTESNNGLPGSAAAAGKLSPNGAGRRVSQQDREGERFSNLVALRAADFDGNGRISSVMTRLVRGDLPAWDIRGKIVSTPGDFALLLQPLRTPLFESAKVAIVDENNTVVHAQVITVGTINETIANPRDVVRVLEDARRITGKKKLRALFSHNHPSGDPSPSNADSVMTRRIREALKAAGSELVDHVITNGTQYWSFEANGKFTLDLNNRAEWEAVPSSSRPTLNQPFAVQQIISLCRQSKGNTGHILYLDTRLQLIAVERTPHTQSDRLTQAILKSGTMLGAHFVILDIGHVPAIETRGLVRRVQDTLQTTGLQLVDAATATIDSMRANGMMEEPVEYAGGLDGFVREGDAAYNPEPAVPEGWDINRFGLRVKADERLRASWRAAFNPQLYKTFGEEELSRRVAAWIGQAGGLAPAAALFMDEQSGLIDYERNALGQQVAAGLDTRARRMEATGNREGMEHAEAMFDQVIGRLEQLATQAGQALRAFGMWGSLFPRGVVRTVERKTADLRADDAEKDLGRRPEEVIQMALGFLVSIRENEKKKRAEDTRKVAKNWIEKLAKSQSDTLSWAKPRVLGPLEALIPAHMEKINPIFAAQAVKLGVRPHAADVLDKLILEEHRRRKGIQREREAEQFIKQLAERAKPKVKKNLPYFVSALFKAGEAGVLTRGDFLDAYAKAFNKPRFTHDFAAEVRQQVERVQACPDGSWLKQKEQSTLLAMLARFEGIKSGEIWTAFWYANILSGLGTQLVNISGNAAHLLLRTVQIGLTNHPKHTMNFVKGMLQGAAQGGRQAGAAFLRGEPVMRGDEQWQRMDVLEMLWSDKPETWGGKLAKYGAASWGRYVFRGLTAADAFFWNTAKEGRAWVDLSRRLEKGQNIRSAAGLDADTWEAAQEQAAMEVRAARGSTSTADIDRRAFEIVEGGRSTEVTHTARRWGAHATYNYNPEGTMGAIAEAANMLLQRLPLARIAVPFVKIVANITDVNLDWTPVGLLRAAKGGHLFNSKGERFTRAERNERIVSGAVGTLAMAALLATGFAYAGDDDDRVPFMIYGMGPKDPGRRAQMPAGWKPFTMKIGSHYVTFDGTPLAFVLGTIGTALDNERYGTKRGRGESAARALALMTAAPRTLMNSGVLSSLNQTFEMMSGERSPAAWSERLAASTIPAASMMRDIAVALDPVQVDGGKFGATFLSYLPVLRGKAQPLMNVFGEPVKAPGPWLLQRLMTTQERSDADAVWLTQHKFWIPSIDTDVAVGQWLEKGDKPKSAGGLKSDRAFRAEILERIRNGYLTPAERNEFIRHTGPQIRKAVAIFRQRSQHGARVEQKDINTAVERIRHRAMKALVK